ncbi:MAG: SpoVA/SpoVAEb family sporulation membrane protein [Firmicutes bacterium]|nr:SpoVA/SpoVAEb family sporulation membrane protein [Bacillota bacterium]
MDYLLAFVVGGIIVTIGQLIFDLTKLTMGHVMVILVVTGSALTAVGLYEPLVELAGAGAAIPVSNFGYVLTQGVYESLLSKGIGGVWSGVFNLAGGAIAAAIFFGFIFGIICRPKG